VTVTVAEKQDCSYRYWFDNEHSTCGYKEFCGEYMYYGLQTFATESECNNALANQTVNSYGVISGTVRDKNGNPVAGALVKTVYYPQTTCNSYGVDTTDYDGRYEITGLTTGYYVIKASKSGYTLTNPTGSVCSSYDNTYGEGIICISLGSGNCGATQEHKTANFVLSSEEEQQEDPVSGTLSVNKTSVGVGEHIIITVNGQDNNGLSSLYAYWLGHWHSYSCSGGSGEKTCSHTFDFYEEKPGTYVYYGYVYGKKSDGTAEGTYTKPQSVTVTVTEEQNSNTSGTCTDTDGGTDYYEYGRSYSTDTSIEGRIDCCKMNYSTNMGDSVNHIGPGGGSCVSEGPYLYEAICKDGVPSTVVYKCPNACRNGVCISNTSKQIDTSSMTASIQILIDKLSNMLRDLKD